MKKPKVKIAAILPSRGLLFSESFEELLRELKPFEHKIFFAHGKPIPDCFNVPTERALEDKSFTHVLFFEDDMMIPEGVLKKMLKLDYPAVALDYPFKNDGEATVLHDPSGYALYTGMGFMLVWREVLEKFPKPIFRTDIAWDMKLSAVDKEKGYRTLYMFPRDVSKIKTYGLQDINFGLTMWTNKMPIMVAAPAGQRKLVAMGMANTNNGAHIIKTITRTGKDNITKHDDMKLAAQWTAAYSQVGEVQVLEKAPDDVEIIDGQARLRGGGDVVI